MPAIAFDKLDEKVTIRVAGKKVTITPEVFVISSTFDQEGRSPLTFIVEGLGTDESLEIDFKLQGRDKGPFRLEGGRRRRPVRGRYLFNFNARGASSQPSGGIDPKFFGKRSVWKYDVVLRRGSEDLVAIDPMGVLK